MTLPQITNITYSYSEMMTLSYYNQEVLFRKWLHYTLPQHGTFTGCVCVCVCVVHTHMGMGHSVALGCATLIFPAQNLVFPAQNLTPVSCCYKISIMWSGPTKGPQV